MCAGQRGDLLLHFFSPLPELLSEWQDDNMKGNMSTRFSLTNCASTCLKHGKIRFFLPIYKMPTKLILLTETLMELAQGFHKQNLIDQRDIER